jgi:hypothetical protein
VMIGGCAGLFLLILGRFRPMTISVFADLFLMLPALAQFLPWDAHSEASVRR